jgi:mono/diheme cytochrome c family protein
MLKRMLAGALLGGAFLLVAFSATTAVNAQRAKDPLARGRKLYYQYCASCHGEDSRGSGPVAASLKGVVPDLHKIAKVNGKFPMLHVKHIITGEVDTPAHGSKEMPVWGRYFRETKGNSMAEVNIYALTRYLEAMQEK